jgi:type IV secretory pathway VirB4 component
MRRRGERVGHRATTATAQAIYPFVAERGLGDRGVYVGRDLYGGSFTFDPFVLYEQRVSTNPNMLVIGEVGSGKSSLVKSYLYRQKLFGRRCWIADPKGEYGPFAEAVGGRSIRLEPGGIVRLNPIGDARDPHSQLALLRAVTSAALRRLPAPEEDAALREALRVVNARSGEPTLPDVVGLLLRPTDAMASALATSPRRLAGGCRDAGLALQRLCEGDLRGMFDGPTSLGVDFGAEAVVLDLSAFHDSSALGLLMTCAAAWQRSIVSELHQAADQTGRPAPKVINVFDEAWRALSVLGVGEWLQDSFKKARSYGVQNVVVMHRLSDLSAVGSAGSREVAIAEGLLHDAQIRVIYRQVEDEVPRTRELLGLTSLEASLLPTLATGVALWKVGTRSFLVQHRISDIEADIVDTDGRMLDRQSARHAQRQRLNS